MQCANEGSGSCSITATRGRQSVALDRGQLREYLDAQVEEILKYKWIESERADRDIGFHRAALEWSDRFGDQFRSYWFGIVLRHA